MVALDIVRRPPGSEVVDNEQGVLGRERQHFERVARGLDVLGEICSISNAATSRATRDDWDDTEWMASLLPLCADVLDGDWRCLYLAWLCGVQGGERREAAARTDNAEEFTERLRPFLDRHTRKTCLIRRLRGPIARSHNG